MFWTKKLPDKKGYWFYAIDKTIFCIHIDKKLNKMSTVKLPNGLISKAGDLNGQWSSSAVYPPVMEDAVQV